MNRSMRAASSGSARGGFTLLEVMVSVAILAVAIVPMLFLREDSYRKALFTKAVRVAHELAQRQLSVIALEVRTGEGAGNFEDWPDYQFEYKVSLYDFSGSMSDKDEEDPYGWYDGSDPSDSVFADGELKEYGPMVMRHVELKIVYPSFEGEEAEMSEYIVDTYMPMLMTEEQYDYQQNKQENQE